jgi:hypothetical protein
MGDEGEEVLRCSNNSHENTINNWQLLVVVLVSLTRELNKITIS